MTQHTTGVQGIRSFTILQLLLGNIGKPGGGVKALRGEPNVQGACDMAVLYNYIEPISHGDRIAGSATGNPAGVCL